MEIVSPYLSPEEYLERAYAHQKEIGGIYIPFYDILGELFKDLIQPDKAATHVSSFIFSNEDFLSVYSGVISSIISAAQELSEAHDLDKLANLVLALSQLPDIRNESSETLHLNFNLNTYEIAPGQVFKVDDEKIWSELPGFATDLGDCMRGTFSLLPNLKPLSNLACTGPTAYINDGTPEHIAEQHWTNQNTFAAYLIHGSSDSPCDFNYLYQYGFRVLADSLEWDARTVEGMDSLHSLRATMRWITIAGDEVWERTRTYGGWAVAGPLWLEVWEGEDVDEQENNAINSITLTRWLLWAGRLNGLAESNMIDEESKAMARSSAETIRGFEGD
jgi:hypothetical protein